MAARSWVLPIAAALFLAAAPAPGPPREIDNVAAFARLYGVVRFFYPSDAAAELDWNRFAVHGVAQVRAARDPSELAATLRRLVSPLGPGIEIAPTLPAAPAVGTVAEPLVAWRYLGAGVSSGGGPYRAKRTHRPAAGGADGFVTLMQTLPAEPWRGKAIRLRAQLRAKPVDSAGGAALWLRVDRQGGTMGFFDNMGDRPVRDGEWRPYSIEGTVAEDAERIAFGVMAMGAVTADFDAVELAVQTQPGTWTPVPIADAGFEAALADKSGWFRTGTNSAATILRPAEAAPEGAQYLRLAPPDRGAPDLELFTEGAPTAGAHADLDLGAGLRARVPLALADTAARRDPSREASPETMALRSALPTVAGPSATPDVDQRLADVVVAWNVFRHFYPYWSEASVDWESRLRPNLEAARAAEGRQAQLDALRALVADVRDGHGFVVDTLDRSPRGQLPVELSVLDGQLVVTASAVPAEAPIGAVVTAIDGVPAAERLARELALASGSRQFREFKATWPILGGPKDGTARLRLDDGSAAREVTLTFASTPVPPRRPEPVSELQPGIWYVDLTRANMAAIAPKLPALAAARGVVFDLRGYPTDAGAGILPHLLDAPEDDRWMHVARLVGPFYETAGWQSLGWDMKPATPRIAGKRVFLTNGGAISYAESVMGYVADRKLATIVGSTTAGTNGNVASFLTPGGFNLGFTGMRVTRHDGRSVHHLVGVAPDIPVSPTLAGLRAGRDEVLERALALFAGQGTEGR